MALYVSGEIGQRFPSALLTVHSTENGYVKVTTLTLMDCGVLEMKSTYKVVILAQVRTVVP